MKVLEWLGQRIVREPVLLVGALYATAEAIWPDASTGVKLAWTAWGTFVQRLFSSPKSAVDAATVIGYNTAVAEVSSMNLDTPPPATLPPQ